MGFNSPPMPWSVLERTLSGVGPVTDPTDGAGPTEGAGLGGGGATEGAGLGGRPEPADETPSPRKRRACARPSIERADGVGYAELHAHSSFSFLDGASGPAELAEQAERLGLHALALTDHDGLYGVVRFAEAAERMRVKTVFGAELSLRLPEPQAGRPDPAGTHLLVLARGEEGYHRLAAAITRAQLAGEESAGPRDESTRAEKGRPIYDLDDLAACAGGHWVILTGCRKGAVRQALAGAGASAGLDVAAAGRELDALRDRFGRVCVELIDHGLPRDSAHNDALAALAVARGLPVVATGNVHYATPAQHPLAQAVAAIRANRSMDDLDGWLPAAGTAFLRSGAEQAARFARYPRAVAHTVELADELAFSLRRARPALPQIDVPAGHTPMSWLRELVWAAVPARYPDLDDAGRARIERELSVIEAKDFPGYFLIVHGIVAEARRRGILCQGRGSAANSAVCYLLDITAVDSIAYDLPFERFLSSLRDEEPDIDVDFDSDRREEIIQWVFQQYGRECAAQVCTVIQYRPKNAVRDVARALGYSSGQQDAFARRVERWGSISPDDELPGPVADLAGQLLKTPRHLGIHSGGMVLTRRPVGEVVPIEHARMPGRTVIQWDKDDAAWMGLVKFDLLGLGILAALRHSFDLIAASTGEEWELANLPKEESAVYDMLCRADSIGVFQVESRAQTGLLPRLQPRRFYDLVVQIALIRPGPIQGGAVHPFVRRKAGDEPVTYLHPKLRPALERTLGIPVFQEQLMQMAMAVGECSGEDADLLRRAMGSKRGKERIDSLRERLYAGMARNGLTKDAADRIYAQIKAFADFGFAESHSLSFALLVYASAWLKLHYPAAFLAGLLRAQPMGFYSPATLVADARRHGVTVLRPDVQRSGVDAMLEFAGDGEPRLAPTGLEVCLARRQGPVGDFDPAAPDVSASHRRDGRFAVRLGLAGVRAIGRPVAERVVAERAGGEYRSLDDLARRAGLYAVRLEALATADAFASLGLGRRHALWHAGSAARNQPDTLPGTVPESSNSAVQPLLFEDQTPLEVLFDDLWATGVSTSDHLLAHLRPKLAARGVLTAAALKAAEPGRNVEVAGLVTHRQRPTTASGITFVNLEDETGLVNVVCSAGVWARQRRVLRESRGLIVHGHLERSPQGVVNIVADRAEPLPVGVAHASRDFR